MYIISGHKRSYFSTQAGHVTRLVDWSTGSRVDQIDQGI
jgi:hypothetical protein